MSIVFEMWGRSAASGKSQNHRWGLIIAGNGTPVASKVPLVTPWFAGMDVSNGSSCLGL